MLALICGNLYHGAVRPVATRSGQSAAGYQGGAVSNEDGSAPVTPEPGKPPVVDRDLLAQALEREAARVFEYCRALVGREDVAMSVTEAALNSARSMLQDPDRLRAWLVDLARRQAAPAEPATDPQPGQGVLQPDSREVVELVYRHGIQREDLGAVLGVPVEQAAALLAAAERELGRLEPLAAPDQAQPAPGPADPNSGQATLPPPDRLRAWLFALARQEALAVGSTPAARGAAPGTELVKYIGNYPATTDAERGVLPASWWQESVPQPPSTRRRVRVAALAAVPLAAAIGLAVYLGGASGPVRSSADTRAGGAAPGSAGLPALVLPNASLAAAAPHPSPSPTVPIWALFPASPSPVVPPPPRPSPTPSPKPSATASPKPSATASPKPSATASPKPSATASPKPSATASPKPSATKASATPSPTKTSA
jgi:hypothetical protein